MTTGHHILVVEDEPLIRSLAVELLSDTGYCLLEASSADEALDILARQAADICLLFTDVNMAGSIDGLALAKIVAASWPWIGILITSGRDQPPRQELPPRTHFAAKPWRQATLLKQVEETCARRAA